MRKTDLPCGLDADLAANSTRVRRGLDLTSQTHLKCLNPPSTLNPIMPPPSASSNTPSSAAKKAAAKAPAKKAQSKKAPAKKAHAKKAAANKTQAKKAAKKATAKKAIAAKVPIMSVVVDRPIGALVNAAAAVATAFVPALPAILIPSERRQRALSKMGKQLRRTLEDLTTPGTLRSMARLSMDFASEAVGAGGMAAAAAGPGAGLEQAVLPVSALVPCIPLEPNEGWAHYRERVANLMGPVMDRMKSNAGLTCLPTYSGNALASRALQAQVEEALQDDGIAQMDLDPPVQATAMDDAVMDVDLPLARFRHPDLDGRGVVVAVLDSGADVQHPWLRIHASFSPQGQDVNIPGSHGTHVAGIIASQDSVYPGIAPGVTLLNVRVLDARGYGTAGDVSRGIDRALDEGAHLINLSVGFNHRPTWSMGGHDHGCPDGNCEMCRSVNNAVTVGDGAVAVIVAAGNEHEFCEFLRRNGNADAFDTELGCPGQAQNALTVGALTKQTFLTSPFSSRGPTAYGLAKPDISAPGVNITSAAVVPRDAVGRVLSGLTRADLSRKESGTSMATPIVTGVAALLTQRLLAAGHDLAAMRAALRAELLASAFLPLAAPAHEVGIGRVSLARL